MKKIREPLIFTAVLLPFAILATIFTVRYQLASYDEATVELLISQLGSMDVVFAVSVVQTVTYAVICGFFGYILAKKTGLLKSFRLESKPVLQTFCFSILFGIVFSLDYWTFGAWIPEIQENMEAGLALDAWLASVLYGGIIEEIMLRWFAMSLIAWIIWKIFFRSNKQAPDKVFGAANIVAALLFAAGHLPATVTLFGELTPLLLVRCFLLNGGFGVFFGWLYKRYGIQYAMMGHALLHIVSKSIWMFI